MAETIAVVEDDGAIAGELKTLLSGYGYDVQVIEVFHKVAQQILRMQPHLVLLDVQLPGEDGYTICREVRKQSDVPIIVVTSRDTDIDELMALNMGADDFVSKPYNGQVLQAHISGLLKRSYHSASSARMQFGALTLDLSRGELNCGERAVELTKNEMGILRALMAAQGGIVSRQALIEELWQGDDFVDDNTLTVNINRLRGKLHEVGAGGKLATKRGMGYMLCE